MTDELKWFQQWFDMIRRATSPDDLEWKLIDTWIEQAVIDYFIPRYRELLDDLIPTVYHKWE